MAVSPLAEGPITGILPRIADRRKRRALTDCRVLLRAARTPTGRWSGRAPATPRPERVPSPARRAHAA
ncbi:MAG TPA: hypothetical protein VIC85_21800, partial [Ktedonobacterales bacterium]